MAAATGSSHGRSKADPVSKSKQSSTSRPQYNPHDVEDLLANVPDATQAVLAGGQAINFWATRYVDRFQELRKFQPFTSADIDFIAGVRLAKKWAKAIGAKLVLSDVQDHVAINTAKLIVPKKSAGPLELDFLAAVDGVNIKRARASAPIVQSKEDKIEFSVLHPLHCLASALANAYGKQRRRDHGASLGERARDRCKLTILVCRAYLLESIELYDTERDDAMRPYDLIEYVAHIAMSPYGLAAYAEDMIDVLRVIDPAHSSLSAEFRTKRWPAIQAGVAEARTRYKPGSIMARKRSKM